MLGRVNLWKICNTDRDIVLVMETDVKAGIRCEMDKGFEKSEPSRGWFFFQKHVRVICVVCQVVNYVPGQSFGSRGPDIIRDNTKHIIDISHESEPAIVLMKAMEAAVIADRCMGLMSIVHANAYGICGGPGGSHGNTHNLAENSAKGGEVACSNISGADCDDLIKGERHKLLHQIGI